MNFKHLVFLTCLTTLFCLSAKAQDDLAKQSQNPVGNMISLPVELSAYDEVGPTDSSFFTLIAKPVYPTPVAGLNLINRFIIPFKHLEGIDEFEIEVPGEGIDVGDSVVFPGTGDETGLGNIQYQGFLSPSQPGKIIWGLGPVVELPTATDDALGTDKWSAGPGIVILTMPGNWVVGGTMQNIWDFAGDSDAPAVNLFTLQPIINYNLKSGWYLTSTPLFTANWEAGSGEEWTVPIGGGIGKLERFGNQPVDIKFTAYWNVESPKFGPDWSTTFSVKWLFPKG